MEHARRCAAALPEIVMILIDYKKGGQSFLCDISSSFFAARGTTPTLHTHTHRTPSSRTPLILPAMFLQPVK